MNQNEINEKFDNIISHLKNGDIQSKAASLNLLSSFLEKKELNKNQESKLIEILKEYLNDFESPLRTDIFNVILKIGNHYFSLIKDIFPIILEELEKKNRFRIKIILDMLQSSRNSNNPEIEDSIRYLITNSPRIFKESYLKEILLNFFRDISNLDQGFIAKYKKDIQKELHSYSIYFPELHKILVKQIKNYEDFLKQEQIRKKEQREERKQHQLKREKLRIKRLEQMEKARNREKTGKQKIIEEKPSESKQKEKEKEKENKNKKSSGEKPKFASFTGLGLKRREDNGKKEEKE